MQHITLDALTRAHPKPALPHGTGIAANYAAFAKESPDIRLAVIAIFMLAVVVLIFLVRGVFAK